MSRFQRNFLAQFCFDRVEKKPETEKERERGGKIVSNAAGLRNTFHYRVARCFFLIMQLSHCELAFLFRFRASFVSR